MDRLCINGYRALIDSSHVIQKDRYGEKVLQTPEGKMIKIFRRKRFLSTALFYPYGLRFIDNAEKLARLGIPTIKAEQIWHSRDNKRHLVQYVPLPGEDLRKALSKGDAKTLLTTLSHFLAHLHKTGVFFRSIHFANIIVNPDDGSFGLIDIADMKIKNSPLTPSERARNFRHLLRYDVDKDAIENFGAKRFVNMYLDKAGLSGEKKNKLLELINHVSLFTY